MHIVQHWAVGYNDVGYAPNPDVPAHGLSLLDAVMVMAGHMYEFAHHASSNAEAGEFRRSAKPYDPSLSEEAYESIIAGLEEAARRHGPIGSLSHVVRGIEFWVMPCFIVDCDQVNEEEQ